MQIVKQNKMQQHQLVHTNLNNLLREEEKNTAKEIWTDGKDKKWKENIYGESDTKLENIMQDGYKRKINKRKMSLSK